MTVEIPLTQGYVAIVDDEDAALVGRYKWQSAVRRGLVYAVTRPSRRSYGKQIRMHDLLVPTPDGMTVDHRNRNTLDNRRSTNLRLATHAQQAANRRGWSSVGFKGIRRERSGRFTARIRVNGKYRHIGTFDAPEDAAEAYDAAALSTFGEFACTNRALREACDDATDAGR